MNWAEPAFAVDRRIRATTPAPGAWTEFRQERMKLGPVRIAGDGPAVASRGPARGEAACAGGNGDRAGRAG